MICAAAFANGTFGAAFVSSDGTWLSDPMAVLRAIAGGKPVSALLRLSNPHYDAANNILTLGVRYISGSLIIHLLPLFCSIAIAFGMSAAYAYASFVTCIVPSHCILSERIS